MLNKIFLQGRLVADPELRHTQTGVAVASFRLAVDRDFKDRETGERKADFINVVAWRQHGESSSPASSPRAVWPWWRAGSRPATTPTGTATSRYAAEVVADNVYFGDSRRDGRRRLHTRPPGWPEQRLRCPRRQQQLPPLRRRLHCGPCGGSVC